MKDKEHLHCHYCHKYLAENNKITEDLPVNGYPRHYCRQCYAIRKYYVKKVYKLATKLEKIEAAFKHDMLKVMGKIYKVDLKSHKKVREFLKIEDDVAT